ncbi:leucine-rich repeat flightless-interacting protein 2 isoform X3 [Parasteatoda tepidariorum]|uniref:leucine-rich repeat flightless-interacting protein 2 isoform X3 n=1 Tax=Parasteatoda tepidariorum TaxID=114398 RepID=UPI001C71C8D8|nr:leucine-rich repeat flightless-interacting protein 2 isoform X3 [Parasteatoda tepidariorum]
MGMWCSTPLHRAKLRRMRKILISLVEYAEARLVARRQARAEAREIRMREIEKQKESEEHGENHYDDHLSVEPSRPPRGIKNENRERAPSYISERSCDSRRSSEEFPDTIGSKEYKLLTNQVMELEEKFRKAMITTAQLDNEKTTLSYQVDTLKDELQELEELHLLEQKDFKSVTREHDLLSRDFKDLRRQNELLTQAIKMRDELISEHNLILVGGEEEEVVDDEDDLSREKKKSDSEREKRIARMALVSPEGANILKQAGSGTLDVRLKKLSEEKQDLLDEIYRLRLDLEEERQKAYKMDQLSLMRTGANGPEMKLMEVQREANKQVNDYKYRLKKAEQEITTLQGTVSRLDNHMNRYKAQAESYETVEDELKAEKRKLQREFRDAQARIEELETANIHLQKRIDKLKTVKSILAKS